MEGCAARLAALRAIPAEVADIMAFADRTGQLDPADLSARAPELAEQWMRSHLRAFHPQDAG